MLKNLNSQIQEAVKWKKYTSWHIVVNYRIPNTVVLCSQNDKTKGKKMKFFTKGTLTVYNLGRRKMIPVKSQI